MDSNTTYQKAASYEAQIGQVKKCVLLYSGGLDTSVMLKWIKDTYGCEIIALTLDLGQQADDLEEVKAKALRLGASKAYVLDCKEEFANDYISKAIKANASYQGDYHLSTPIGRPLIAKKAVEIALQEGADAIAHGCTGKGNDQVRIEATVLCYAPKMKIIAPVREWGMGREEEIEYAKKHGIETPQTKKNLPYSWDDNMWGLTGEGGEIENPSLKPKLELILQVCKTQEEASDQKEEFEIEFAAGVPVAINGEKKALQDIIKDCNAMGAKHAIGYVILIEDRLVGLKVRGVYENPGAHIIVTTHKNLEKIVSTQTENELKEFMDSKWAYMCYSAKWMDPTMKHVNSFIASMNEKVTGKVRFSLYKGKIDVLTVNSPYSLFNENLATFNKNVAFNQNASAGFIEIYSLAMKTHYQVEQENHSK
ncbi:MAG: argininosuccinate synthase [Candidatus Gracilibacteria bacterium]|jgi:argininosuccinate synthase